MDPDYRRDGPGKSPMGMDLVPVYADSAEATGDDDSIRISPAVENNLGVRTGKAEFRLLPQRIETTAYVTFDEDLQSHIHVRTPGWIESLAVEYIGKRVRKGQVLFEYYAPEIVNAQKEYLHARGRGEESIRLAAREKLIALGMLREEIDELDQRGTASHTIRVLAPQDGVVTAMHAREGMYLMPEMEVFSLADLSAIWMIADVFEARAGGVGTGQEAEARLTHLPEKVFRGVVDYVYPVLDMETRTLRVRLKFDNPGERLKPNMYGSVAIVDEPDAPVLSVHRDALIRTGANHRVIVALGDGMYQAREVASGRESGEWVQILDGLDDGERVVTSAQFMLDSEASLSGSFRRLEPGEYAPDDNSTEHGIEHEGMNHD
jgi:Cu(I)/Ag(I) efflux system membrane fusion protein